MNKRQAHSPLAMTAFVLESVLSLGAIGGGAALMLGPEGELLPLPLSALRGSPFGNSFWPGCLLFTVLGIMPALVAVLVWRQQRFAPLLTIGVGVSLAIWLTVQISIIGYSNRPPLQAIYLLLAVSIVFVGARWQRHSAQQLGRDRRDLERRRLSSLR